MGRQIVRVFWLPVWAGALYGALLLEAVPGDFGYNLCGPWGCWPPIQALAAMHVFWVALFVPPVAWAWRNCQPATLGRLGTLFITLGLLCVGLVVAREALTWYSYASLEYRQYFGRRIVYALATLTDLPAVQLVLAGIACRYGAWRKRRSELRPGAAAKSCRNLSVSQ